MATLIFIADDPNLINLFSKISNASVRSHRQKLKEKRLFFSFFDFLGMIYGDPHTHKRTHRRLIGRIGADEPKILIRCDRIFTNSTGCGHGNIDCWCHKSNRSNPSATHILLLLSFSFLAQAHRTIDHHVSVMH